jgi:hypothetical protein
MFSSDNTLPLNPTRTDIDNYIKNYGNSEDIKRIVREILAKESVGRLLHPSEDYILSKL